MAGETDGEVLAVLDLRVGQEQLELGLAREVVNRVQKLRKHAGLIATDIVQVAVSTCLWCLLQECHTIIVSPMQLADNPLHEWASVIHHAFACMSYPESLHMRPQRLLQPA